MQHPSISIIKICYCFILGKSKKKNVTLHKLKPTEKVRQIMQKKLELEYKFYFYVRRRFDKLYLEINTENKISD